MSMYEQPLCLSNMCCLCCSAQMDYDSTKVISMDWEILVMTKDSSMSSLEWGFECLYDVAHANDQSMLYPYVQNWHWKMRKYPTTASWYPSYNIFVITGPNQESTHSLINLKLTNETTAIVSQGINNTPYTQALYIQRIGLC